jgi:hypothetical protein
MTWFWIILTLYFITGLLTAMVFYMQARCTPAVSLLIVLFWPVFLAALLLHI